MLKRNLLFALCVLALVLPLTQGMTIVVSSSGVFHNISSAAKTAKPGDVIEIQSGTYSAKEVLYKIKGTVDQPITIKSADDANVVFDGTALGLTGSTPVITFINCDNFIIEGPIEIRNSGNGMDVLNATNFEISGLTIHDVYKWALATSGRNIYIHDNEMYNCVMENEDEGSDHGWSQCVASWGVDEANGVLSTNITWENNLIHDSWGEGLDVILCDGCVARGNTVHDAYSVLLYCDNVRNVLVDGNYLYCTDDGHDRSGGRPTVLLIGTESWPDKPIPTVNVTIQNNLGVAGGVGFSYYGTVNYYSNIKVLYNTFWNTTGAGVYIPSVPVSGYTKNNELRNNVFYISNKWWAGSIASSEQTSWSISSNAWLGIASIPSSCVDTTGYYNTSFAISPGYDPATIFSDSCEGDFYDAAPQTSCFVPEDTSPLVDAGIPVSSVKTDFFGCKRDEEHPCMGYAEDVCHMASGISAFPNGSLIMGCILLIFIIIGL